jgi:hypothetical protein
MQNEKCKMKNKYRVDCFCFAFFIVHFAFCINFSAFSAPLREILYRSIK